MKNDYPRRGDVYWVRLDPSDGKEIKKNTTLPYYF